MAIIHWLDSNGNWNTAANWTGGVVPGSTDDATIDAAGSYTVSENASPPIDVNSITINPGTVLNISDVAGNQVGTGGVTNNGTLDIDADSGEGGSTLTIGATLSNSGIVNIGNTGLSKATTVTVAGLANSGTINLTGGGSALATLDDTGAAAALSGNISILDDALLEFGSGALGGTAPGTTFSLRNDPTPISLNAGTPGGTFSNEGTLDVDNIGPQPGYGGDPGGSSLAIGASLSNSGTVNIGNTGLSKATTVSATGLSNTGTINLTGGGSALATLDDTGAAPALSGNISILDDALLKFGSGALGGTAAGTTFSLRNDPTPISLNAGTPGGTFNNAGTLDVDDIGPQPGYGGDPGGSSLAIGASLSNSGTVNIGNTGLSKATTVSATGLSNTGTINLTGGGSALATLDDTGAAAALSGNISILDDALLKFGSGALGGTAAGTTFSLRNDPTPISLNAGTPGGTFSNEGTLDVDDIGPQPGYGGDPGGSSLAIGASLSNSGTVNIGNTGLSKATTVSATGLSNSGTINLTGGGSALATLDDTGAAPALSGNISILDDALLKFGSGALGGTAAGTTFSLRNDPTPISLNAGTPGGTFSNEGTLDVDNIGPQPGYGGDPGGSSLAIGASLSNSGTVNIGNTGLSKATTVSATGLSNTGTINLTGGGSALATLDDTGAAAALSGNISILDDALLKFGSGALGGTAAGTTFSLRNDPTPISLNAGTPGGTFSNEGTLDVDDIGPQPGYGGDPGGSSLAIGASLSNSGTVNIGNTGLSKATTVSATGLSNTGTINLTGGGSALATLDDTGAAPALSGNISILDDALLKFGSGALGGTAAGTTFSLRNDPTPISLNAGTPGGTFSNEGTLDVDNIGPQPGYGGDPGGSSLAIGASLSNSGTVNIGNTGLSKATTVSATGLSNTGTINLTGGGSALATLDDTGAAPALSGNISILDDALLKFGSSALGGTAAGTTFSLRNDPTPISLNAGTPGGTFNNAGTLDVDDIGPQPGYGGDPGGSSLAIGASLSNSGTVNIGNTGLSKATTVSATGLSNTGTINLTGGGSALATLDDTGAAAALSGNISILDDALLKFGSGALGGTAAGTTFSLRNDPTPISLNAGTPGGTFSNEGTLDVDDIGPQPGYGGDPGGSSLAIGASLSNSGTVNIGNTGLSKATTVSATGLSNTGTINLTGGGSALATLDDTGAAPALSGNISILDDALLKFGSGALGGTAAGTTFSLRNDPTPISLNAGTPGGTFSNAGTLDVDNIGPQPGYGGDPGGSSLAIGASLSNSGTVNIGNTGLSKATTVSATGLSNTGTINLTGGGSALATLDDTGAAPALSGNISILDDALLEFGSGALGGTAAGTTFSLRNDPTPISLNAGAPGGTFSNEGTLDVDDIGPQPGYGGDPGGSSLAIGASLSNSGTVNIGNTGLSKATTVSATGLSNTGTINLTGGGSALATLDDTGAAPALSGNISILDDALLKFGSGALGGTAAGTTFSLRNDPTPISLNAGTPGGTFSNEGTLDVDNIGPQPGYGGDPGGSSLAIGASLSNSGTVNIGNTGLSKATTVSATGLSNTGTINLTGGGSALATLDIEGPAGNSGTLNVGGFSAINASGETYTQSLGTTTIAATGALTAATIDVTGGVFQGAGTVTGNIVNTGGSVAGGTYMSNSPGTLTVTGTYSQSGSGILQEVLTGTAAGQQSELAVSGDANIQGGTLNADVFFGLAAGETFTVMTFAPSTLPGLFGAIDYGSSVGNRTFVNISGGLTLGALYNVTAGNIELQVLTTPATTADSWNGGSGNWSTATDWTTGVVPTSDTDVTIGQTASGTVTLDTGDTIDSLTITSGNTLNFAANEALVVGANVTVQSGGALTLGSGDGLEAGGTLSEAGQMTVGAGATVELFSTPLRVTGTLTVAGEIETAGATAVTMGSGIDRLILDPGFSFVGLVQGGGVNSTLELAAGTGLGVLNALGTEFTDFGTVTVDAGATWTVDALASALSGVTITGSDGSNTLVITSSGAADLSGVSGFPTIDLASGGNNVAVTNNIFVLTPPDGSVTINVTGGNNSINASDDTTTGKILTVNASGDGSSSTGDTLTFTAGTGTDSFIGGFENDVVYVPAGAAVGGDTLTGGSGTNTLVLRSAGTVSLGGVSKFATIELAAGNNTVTVTDTTLSGGSVTIWDGASGNNTISAAGDTSASAGKKLVYVAGAGTDSFIGGFENDVVYVPAGAAVGGDTLTGGSGTNTLVLRSAGTVSLGGVSKFATIELAAGNNTVTVTDTTLSGGSVTIWDGASGNNTISAAGDTSASAGKKLVYVAGAGTDSFTGGFENDVVYVPAGAAVGGDTLTGGSGTNTLVLRSAGTVSLGGVSKFAMIELAAGNNTVTVTDTTLSGGSVTIWDGASGDNTISAAGDTSASAGKKLVYVAGAGTDSFTGGFENDVVYVPAGAAVGGDTLTGGSGTNTLVLRSAGTVSLGGVSKFATIELAAGNNTVTVTDTTLSGGSVTIWDGASGNNTISAAGDTSASAGKKLVYVAGAGTDSFTGGFENDVVYVPAGAAVGGDTLTGGSGTNTLVLRSAGTVSLGGVSKFAMIELAAGNNTVTVTDTTLSGGSVTIWDGASGNNEISVAGDTSASAGKTPTYVAGAGTDSFTGGFENDVVYVPAGAAVGGDTLTGGSGTNTLVLRSAGTVSLGGVSKFATIELAAGNNTVTVTDTTLSGGSVTIWDGASGNNTISAAGDTSASAGKKLVYVAGAGTDSFTGGFENDVVYVPAGAAVGGDTLTGGSGTNTLVLRSAGTVSLGGVSKFATIELAAGNNTVTVTDTTLSGGSVTIWDGASGNNTISVAGDTSASAGKKLVYVAGAGTDSFTGGFENDVVYVPAGAAVGGDTLTGGSGTNTLVLRSAGTVSLGGVSKFATIELAAGNNTVTVTDTTLSGGSVTIWDGASGDNTISAAGDTSASAGKKLVYVAGAGTDSFTGGFENDVVYVPAGAVDGDTLTGGRGTNTLDVSGGGAAVMGSTITGISTVNLLKAPSGQTQPDYDFTANTLSGLLVDDLNATTPDALVAGGSSQTLTGGGAGMLTMDAANQSSALLKDSASVFSGDTAKDLVNGDMIDITGLGFSAPNTSLGFVYNGGSDMTTMSVALSGTQKTAITLLGQYMAADFSASADTAGTGTLITLTHELNLTMPH